MALLLYIAYCAALYAAVYAIVRFVVLPLMP